jgi:hypothetical protein
MKSRVMMFTTVVLLTGAALVGGYAMGGPPEKTTATARSDAPPANRPPAGSFASKPGATVLSLGHGSGSATLEVPEGWGAREVDGIAVATDPHQFGAASLGLTDESGSALAAAQRAQAQLTTVGDGFRIDSSASGDACDARLTGTAVSTTGAIQRVVMHWSRVRTPRARETEAAPTRVLMATWTWTEQQANTGPPAGWGGSPTHSAPHCQ